jgi:hypothetical protein
VSASDAWREWVIGIGAGDYRSSHAAVIRALEEFKPREKLDPVLNLMRLQTLSGNTPNVAFMGCVQCKPCDVSHQAVNYILLLNLVEAVEGLQSQLIRNTIIHAQKVVKVEIL